MPLALLVWVEPSVASRGKVGRSVLTLAATGLLCLPLALLAAERLQEKLAPDTGGDGGAADAPSWY